MESESMANDRHESSATRRDFLKTTATVAGTAMAAGLLGKVYASGSDTIKVGLVGCGGRGTGAAENCLMSAPNVHLYALADVFKDKLDATRARLTDAAASKDEIKNQGNKVDVSDDRCFIGLDAYQKLLDSGVNYVILATPPGFRPIHLAAAVAAGKNIFTEKPVGVDGAGIRKDLATYEEAKKKNLAIAAGTQRRHQAGYIKTIQQIHDGAIGDITAARCYWNQGGLWHKDRLPAWSDLEYQIRNWLYFAWLSGDHIVEQHVHNLDVVNWAVGSHPIKAMGMGGRQVRTGPEFGHIFDHFATDYEYANGCRLMSMARQIDGCAQSVSEALHGTKGFCQVNTYTINGKHVAPHRNEVDPYVQEHTDLIASIRGGQPINELKNVAESTLTAIMGRMTCYTGKEVTWEKALNSQEVLMPENLSWEMTIPVPPVAIPGKTPLV
jgi:myo-inositol 2-dehydrogenase / D-chiro-inositol 1-dehydrogenase